MGNLKTINSNQAFLAMRSTLRVLLAEDNLVNQKVALRILERLGYQADLAVNGQEVLEMLQRQFYDIVLMDMHMPKMDGIAATRAICETFHAAIRPRIIALTASEDESDRQLCLQSGMDGYIHKPICIEDLALLLQDCESIKCS
jgi:CheY-like chemotaxis protein